MKNRVRELREEKRWSRDDLGARVGVTRVTIGAIETGHFLPSIALAYDIAVALGKSVLEVFAPQGETPGSPGGDPKPRGPGDSSKDSGDLK